MDLSTPVQLMLAMMMAELQQKLKDSTHPALAWIRDHSGMVNKAVAAVLALAATIGIKSTFIVDPSGYASFTLGQIPWSVDAWSAILMQAFTQYWLAKGWFKIGIRQPRELGIGQGA